jgi:hypothetical protein
MVVGAMACGTPVVATREVTDADRAADDVIFDLYGLTATERALVAGRCG